MVARAGAVTEPSDPDTFRLVDWPVFRPGLHNRKLFTPAELDRMYANFQAYSTGPRPWIPVRIKLGHDPRQVFASSVGLPSCGRAETMRRAPDGALLVGTTKMPARSEYLDGDGKVRVFDLLGKVKNGFYAGASVEVPRGKVPAPPGGRPGPYLVVRDEMPSPDGGIMRDGPYLDAIALLGDELPAVHGLDAPDVSYFAADGHTRVVRDTFAQNLDPDDSQPPPQEPPVRDQLNQQLQALGLDPQKYASFSDEQVQTLLADLGGDPNAPPPPAAPGGDPNAPPPQTFASVFKSKLKFSADPALEKRLADLEAFVKGGPKKEDVEQVAKFATTYAGQVREEHKRAATEVVDQAIREGRLLPTDRDDFVAIGLSKSRSDAFAAGDSRTQFQAWAEGVASRPQLDAAIDLVPADAGAATIDSYVERVLNQSQAGVAALRHAKAAA